VYVVTGHSHAFGDNDVYREAIRVADEQFGKILADVEEAVYEKRQGEQWLVMVTADHGGDGDTHGRQLFVDEAIPFMMAIIQQEKEIIGDEHVELRDLMQPIKHYDVAPTVLKWLNLPIGDDVDGKIQGIAL
jgi:arylsulfatase A-like enzyme